MRCPACREQVPDRNRFCENCGTPLAAACPACGSGLTPGKRFCGNCGAAIDSAADAVPRSGPAQPGSRSVGLSPGTELRQVSVLFCDVVGVDSVADSQEPEEVREFLSGYFDLSRAIISRHGGAFEKFVGDAVMAVWGAPVATENDAERAVRAGLELISAIAAYGAEHTAEIQARVGVASGLVATSESTDDGLVSGDRVNTAARIQAAAPPGRCYVDAATKRLAESAISFEDAGLRALKGKAKPEQIFGVVRVLSGVGGRRHVSGLEAPLIGREVELRALKDLFHTCVDRTSPRLVVVSGLPGVGKSRLSWELEKHLDGIVNSVLWYEGRCLSYGDGIAFWALADIVRRSLGIAEDEQPEAAAAKLAQGLAAVVPDFLREYVGACISCLLGIDYPAVKPNLQREQLFAGWRTFFECLARTAPLVLAIENAENADDDLLDFLDHIVDWTRELAVYVLVLTRPELSERRPGFGVGTNRTTLFLEPLQPDAMSGLVDALVSALPEEALGSLAARADGIPLYALETIRSLIDSGAIVKADGGYRLVGELRDLAIPEGLHGLLAARIDAFGPLIRRLVGIAAVLGTTFSEAALVALADRSANEVHDALAELVFRDVLVPDAVFFERASYRFSHGLLRDVAYETLSRRERKARHLAVAAYLRETFAGDGEEVAEIVARHYLDALTAGPEEADAQSIREDGLTMLIRAAERAERTGAPGRAAANFASAAELLTTESGRADVVADGGERALRAAALWEQAARCDQTNADFGSCIVHAGTARRCYLDHGDARGAARAQTLAGRARSLAGQMMEARSLLTEALAVLQPDRDVDTVAALSALADLEVLDGRPEADRLTAEALAMGKELQVDPALLARLFISRGITHARANRMAEAASCYNDAARLAERAGHVGRLGWALANLSDALGGFDSRRAADAARAAAEHARNIGDRRLLGLCTLNLAMALLGLGEWDDADAVLSTAVQGDELAEDIYVVFVGGLLASLRGDCARATASLASLTDSRSGGNAQEQASISALAAFTCAALGKHAEALGHARKVVGAAAKLGIRHETVRWAWPLAASIARSRAEITTCAELVAVLDGYPDDQLPRILRAERALALAAAQASAAEPGAMTAFADAITALRTAASPYHLAHGLLEQADYLTRIGEAAQAAAAADEAGIIGASLRCKPLIERSEARART
jgi:class 3 adenylate cyclase/tetratricopeptide (TPR) repeat protein